MSAGDFYLDRMPSVGELDAYYLALRKHTDERDVRFNAMFDQMKAAHDDGESGMGPAMSLIAHQAEVFQQTRLLEGIYRELVAARLAREGRVGRSRPPSETS